MLTNLIYILIIYPHSCIESVSADGNAFESIVDFFPVLKAPGISTVHIERLLNRLSPCWFQFGSIIFVKY